MYYETRIKHWGATVTVSLLAAACAQQQPAQSYVEAQKTYESVSTGHAQEYAPDELLEARHWLDEAAEAKNGSERQEHLSYVADRQARLARSSGTIEYYQIEKSNAQANYIRVIESERRTAKERLEETREQLNQVAADLQKKDANVEELEVRRAELEKRKNSLESQLTAKEAALTESEAARKDAEERAKAAIASLNELANVKEEANETVITLSGSVLFKTGESELLPLAKNRLSKVAAALKTLDDEKRIVVEGHTDSRGATEMNRELSQKRAESVRAYLIEEGVDKSRLEAKGRGETEPIASNDSPEGRANNRRVELHITDGAESKSSGATAQTDKR